MMSEKRISFLAELQKRPSYWAEYTKTEFTEEIARLMKEQGVSKKELAQLLGTSPSYVTKVLNENVNFTIDSMTKIAFALGCKIDIAFAAIEPLQPQKRMKKFRIDMAAPQSGQPPVGNEQKKIWPSLDKCNVSHRRDSNPDISELDAWEDVRNVYAN